VFVDGAGSELRFSGEYGSMFDARMTVGKIALTGDVTYNNGAMRPWLHLWNGEVPKAEWPNKMPDPLYTGELYVLKQINGQIETDWPPSPKDPTVETLLLPNFSYSFYGHFQYVETSTTPDFWPGDVFRFDRCEPDKSAHR
jgi:hypothetical protein